MADRVFKGRLIVTEDIHEANQKAFPEASEDFRKPHKGGLDPYQSLYDIFKSVELYSPPDEFGPIMEQLELAKRCPVEEINGSIWISGEDAWIKIDPDGSFEIGIPGA